MTTTLETSVEVDAALQQLDAQNEAAYRSLVLDLADGKAIDPATLRPILQAADRTVDDLKRHQRIASERRQAVANLQQCETLGSTLADLQAKSIAAADAVRIVREKHAAELEPLLAKARLAADAFTNTRIESRSLRQRATSALSRTTGPEYHAQFARLSNSQHLAGEKLSELRERGRREDGDRDALEREAAGYRKELRRFEGSANPGDAPANYRKALADIEDDIANLDQLGAAIEAAWKEHEAAKAALAEFEQTEFYNWGNMSFV